MTAQTLVEPPSTRMLGTGQFPALPGACSHVAVVFHVDSPSIMDISITSEVEEKRPNVNNVPDYITDIHTYLREMEVRCRLFSCLHAAYWGESKH